ncbi:exported hypothetical protein [Verrucomicrobia bacterium]|nr:exported hypothetical protein [Verrucomicrobiota bacterium]
MKTKKPVLGTISIVSLAALAAQISSAQPAGSITNQITGSTNVLWDFSQLTGELQTITLNVVKVSRGQTNGTEVSFTDSFTQDGRGKLAGSGITLVTLIPDVTQPETNTFDAKYVTRGSVTSSKGVARLTFSVTLSGRTVVGNSKHPAAERSFTAKANYALKFDAKAGQVSGRVVESAAATGLGSITETKPITDTLPSDLGDGTWTLVLNFAEAVGDKLSGIGTVTLETGQTYPFAFTGTYTSNTGESKLNLKGTGAGLGSMLKVTLHGSQLTGIMGQVAGQTVDVKE